MKKQILTLLTLLSCVALSAQTVDVRVCQTDKFLAGCAVYDRTDGDQTGISVDLGEKSYTLNLHWGESATFAYTDSMAVGGKYLFGCQVLTEAGTYYDTLTTATGCDSIVTLTLKEYVPCSPVEFTYTDSMAVGGTYIFNCQVLTKAGTYTETLTKTDGCDSVVTLTLKEYIPCSPVEFAYTDSMAVGGTYIFNCQVLTKAGTYTETLTKTDGCDSVVVLTLKEFTPVVVETHDTLRKSITANLCYEEAFATRWDTIYPTKDTTFSDTVIVLRDTVITLAKTTIHTIDSVYIYDLHVWPDVVRDTLRDTVLVDSLPYIWTTEEGKILSISAGGLHSDTVRNSLPQQCDSLVHFLDLAIIAHDMIDTIVEDVNLCYGESYTSRSQVVTPVLAGDTSFNDTIPSRMIEPLLMHDSVYHYTLHIWPDVRRDTVKDTILVDLLPYTWTTEEGHEYAIRAGGFHSDTVRNSLPQHCDSLIHTLDLAIIAHDTVYVPVQEFTVCYLDVVPTRTQDVTIHQDTAWSEWMPNIPMEPLLIRDSVYQYSVKMSSPYVDSLPALVKDESWLLMINRRSINNDYHIGFTAEQVHWYRVEGEVDQYPYGEKNDVFVGTGDYYTIAQKLTGRYYAILDGVDISAYGPCVKIARTVVLNCDQRQSKALRLLPSLVTIGEPMTLSNIDATGESEITILNADGTVMHRFRVSGTDKFQMHANGVPGMYMMHVQNSSQRSTLKYIVKP